jgi:hypothetical protein
MSNDKVHAVDLLEMHVCSLYVYTSISMVEPYAGLHSVGRILKLPSNIRLGYKLLTGQNTITYQGT